MTKNPTHRWINLLEIENGQLNGYPWDNMKDDITWDSEKLHAFIV